MDYYTSQYTPAYKFKNVSTAATNTIVWTPAASARIILTDCVISANTATSIRLFFGGASQAVIFDHVVQGSAMVYPITSSIVDSLVMDAPLVAVVSAAASGGVNINVNGFEDQMNA